MQEVKDMEEKVLEFWKRENVYEKVKEMLRGKPKYFFLDGPPYASGFPHIGTVFNKILKDCYLRFLRMRGFDVWDQPGYDCHGLPIEHKVEQKLGFKSKKDVEAFGVVRFIEECRKFAMQHVEIMSKEFSNVGVWMDWKNPYLTLSNDYIECAWFTFKKAFEKGLLYKGKYPVHLCPRCQTIVAYNEIEYTKVSDPSIYVKFKLVGEDNKYLLIWTTTPWTLPANVAVMAHPEFEYAEVKVGSEILIIAKELVPKVMKEAGIEGYEILKVVSGRELNGLKYEHPLKGLIPFHESIDEEKAWKVVLSEEYVTLEEGTGLVHCAPGHGKEDYEVGLKYDLPAPSPVRMDGRFDDTCGKFAGIFVKDADDLIIDELENRGLLFHKGRITHDYPLCWRCDSPLLLILVPQWFFRVTQIREKLLEENEKIEWIPGWAGKRFKNWLENLGDWPISRQRYWGIPLPIWECKSCGNIKVIGSAEELPTKLNDLHKPGIDEVTLKCEKCGGEMKRIPDVLDVWFDSGVAPWASLGYPKRERPFKDLWPVKFVLEGPDQIRGWWNSLLITSVITFGRRSFERVLFNGFVLDAHGVKMSKSRGNIVTANDVIEKYGRDVLRVYFLADPCWEDYRFKWEEVKEIARKLNILRNTFAFIELYVKEKGEFKNPKIEDRWILSKVNSLVKKCNEYFEKCHLHKVTNEILNFVLEDFSRWYIKKVRDRVWVSYEGVDKKAACFTLLKVADTLLRLLAPITPFLSEHFYQRIVRKFFDGYPESVHMLQWPRVEEELIDEEFERKMEVARRIFEACTLARQRAGIKLRWPIEEVIVVSKDETLQGLVDEFQELLAFFCNAKRVIASREEPREIESYVAAEFELGKVLVKKTLSEELLDEAFLREVVRKVQQLRKEYGFKVEEKISLSLLTEDERLKDVLTRNIELVKKEVGAKKVSLDELVEGFEGNLEFLGKGVKITFRKE